MIFYVSLLGSDNNNGNISSPFKTLSKALTVANTNDTVVFLKGTYEIPTININIDGLTIKPHLNEKVIIDGTKSINDLKDTNAIWQKIIHNVSSENGSSILNTVIYKIKIKDNVEIWQLFNNRKEI